MNDFLTTFIEGGIKNFPISLGRKFTSLKLPSSQITWEEVFQLANFPISRFRGREEVFQLANFPREEIFSLSKERENSLLSSLRRERVLSNPFRPPTPRQALNCERK